MRYDRLMMSDLLLSSMSQLKDFVVQNGKREARVARD
jgi:hypothetical protein